MQTTLMFNPKATSIANFTLIRQDKDCLRVDFKSEVRSQKNCIETKLNINMKHQGKDRSEKPALKSCLLNTNNKFN